MLWDRWPGDRTALQTLLQRLPGTPIICLESDEMGRDAADGLCQESINRFSGLDKLMDRLRHWLERLSETSEGTPAN